MALDRWGGGGEGQGVALDRCGHGGGGEGQGVALDRCGHGGGGGGKVWL